MDLQAQRGLMTTYREGWRNRGPVAWVISAVLITFYVLLYFEDELQHLSERLGLGDRFVWHSLTWVAHTVHLPDKWFLYGALYSVLMIVGGVRYLRIHGSSRYNLVRIGTNITVQVILGFSVPFVMERFLHQHGQYLSYFWPLSMYSLYPGSLKDMPAYFAAYFVIGSFVIAPAASILFGKRWYCSWVCGCGALANTFGDPWRHLTSKTSTSWAFEKVSIHSVLVLAMVTTALVWAGQLIGSAAATGEFARYWYGFFVSSLLAGAVGTGLYPILGTRVWCRNFCPMAAMLGIFQKAGRFRIRVKPDMCISCGNCTTYCEMGIDVRSYAQSNQSFTRASCVGCGMCAHVCPRGVLKLENSAPRAADKRRQGIDAVDF
jgi:polyferredoxin